MKQRGDRWSGQQVAAQLHEQGDIRQAVQQVAAQLLEQRS
jgi:hypothetical protein